MAENVVACFVLKLKYGKVPCCHSVKDLQRVILCVLDEVIVQRGLLVSAKQQMKYDVKGSCRNCCEGGGGHS